MEKETEPKSVTIEEFEKHVKEKLQEFITQYKEDMKNDPDNFADKQWLGDWFEQCFC